MMRRAAVAALLLAGQGCTPRVTFSEDAVDGARLGQGLPRGFLLGAATSPHQIEGGTHNDWSAWEVALGGDTAEVACDSWNRFPQDLAALQSLGANSYRLGIEWSRLEPSEGAWDAGAAARYREMLTALRGAGITPLVTVYHYTLPRWVAERGGWEWDGIVPALAAFSRRAGETFGDLVDTWITINEPNALAPAAYAVGIWPPGVKDTRRAFRVYATLIRAHGPMTAALRAGDTADADGDGRATFIGLAHNLVPMQPASSSVLDVTVAGMADDVFNESVPRAAATGWIRIHVPGVVEIDEYVPELVGSFDYLGVNYYRRQHLRAAPASPELAERFTPDGLLRADNDWEIYPEGLYDMLVRFGQYGLPIIVTENGVADATDALRPRFLRAHLYAIQRAVEDGVDVRGYFHWSLMDNFEWDRGYQLSYGLFSVDRDGPALERRPRPSAAVFREAARGLGLHPLGP